LKIIINLKIIIIIQEKTMKRILALSFLPVLLISVTAGAAAVKTFNGYLSDTLCATSEGNIAADGSNMKTSPEKHSVACLRNGACMASGFGILIKNNSGTYDFTKFDAAGNKMVKALLKSTRKTANYFITVKGVMVKDMIKVSKIIESEPMTAQN
jgi:hypothetical protein